MHIVPKLDKDFQVNKHSGFYCIYNKKFGPEKLNLSFSSSTGIWLRIGTINNLSEVIQQIISLLKKQNKKQIKTWTYFMIIVGVIITLLLLFQF